MRGADAARQAEAARIFFLLGGTIHAAAAELSQQNGAWLSSRQNPAEMSAGLNNAGYEELIYLVSQTESSMVQPISDYDMHLLGVVSL